MKKRSLLRMTMAMVMVMGLLISTTVMATEKADQQTIQGTVEKGEKGITLIKADDGQTYTIVGKNLAELVGKKVKITGMLTKGAKNKAIVASSFEEIKE